MNIALCADMVLKVLTPNPAKGANTLLLGENTEAFACGPYRTMIKKTHAHTHTVWHFPLQIPDVIRRALVMMCPVQGAKKVTRQPFELGRN